MREIELSTMIQVGALDLAFLQEHTYIQTRHQQYDFSTGWNDVLQIAIYQRGPDISEVGSTWLDNLIGMNALRAFSLMELHALGGREAFLPSAWSHAAEAVDGALAQPSIRPPEVYNIPWTVDTRLVHYRADLLAKAGISAEGAFDTPDALLDTLERLCASGVQYPLAMATGGLTLHNLACFVWGRGGEFRSPDGRRVTLIEPEARRGLFDYFDLGRFIAPAGRAGDYAASDSLYFNGSAAVLLSGPWVMRIIKSGREDIDPAVLANTRWAGPPGVPYVGGTSLVKWRHSLSDQEAVRLIAHLTSPAVMINIHRLTGNFPARLAVLNAEPFSTDPDYQLVRDCILRGRMFQSSRMWAGVEMRLSGMIDQLWTDLFANPDLNLKGEIEKRVSALASRLERTLLAN